MASGPMKPDQVEIPPTYPVPPPYGADPGYGFGPAVYPMQSGPSPSVSSTNYGVFQTQPGYPQSPPTQVAWADNPPPWSPAVQGQPMGYMSGPPGFRPQPYQQQQQQVVVIGTSGPSTAIPIVHVESFAGHIVLSCFVLWCCNLLFGLIAFILAAVASSNAIHDPRQARSLGKASYGVSIAGIVVTAVVITIVVSVVVSANSRMYNNLGSGSSSVTCSYYYYNSVCYRTYSRYYTMSECKTYLNGYYYGSYCYYNY